MADKVLHWGWITIQVLFVILMLYQLPPHLVSTYRKTADWWALSSHRRTVRRLTKLEVELHKLDEPIDLAYLQILFYNIVTFVLLTLSAGAMCAAYYAYAYFWASELHTGSVAPILFMAFCVVFFVMSVVVAWWGAFRFQNFLPSHRTMKRRQIEEGIRSMQDKLKQVVRIQPESPDAPKDIEL
jgi:hypothetical protein